MLNPRKFAAIDIVFLGSSFIISEFASAVFLCTALGALILFRGKSFWQMALGLYVIALGMNYVPMLYAIAISRARSARAEMGDELNEKRQAMYKYRKQSIWLLVPLLVPIIVLIQECRDRSTYQKTASKLR